jgi:hypothetical protein
MQLRDVIGAEMPAHGDESQRHAGVSRDKVGSGEFFQAKNWFVGLSRQADHATSYQYFHGASRWSPCALRGGAPTQRNQTRNVRAKQLDEGIVRYLRIG